MSRFNFNNITLQSNADISKVMENFNKIENNAVLVTDLVTALVNGLMSKEDKAKLDGIENNANNYTLPTGAKNVLGGVKTTSNVSSATGYTACPIINGVPYYKGASSYNDLSNKPIINCGNLVLTDNSLPNLENGNICLINNLTVNSSTDNMFKNSLAIFYKESNTEASLKLLVSDNFNSEYYKEYFYEYQNGIWALINSTIPYFDYGTEDLEAGVSQLDDGDFYFKYEE